MHRILAIDQGTSSTKALVFDQKAQLVSKNTAPLETIYPHKDWVEQNPEAIYQSVLNAVESLDLSEVKSIGISNQRETFVLWDKQGTVVHNAVVWSCKRSIALCENLQDQSDWIQEKTGLCIDPYFSGTKLLWIAQNDPALHKRIQKSEIYFGTIDTWLLYKLTNGASYATDTTNASRTLLFNIHQLDWDQEIIEKWGLSGIKLPKVNPSAAYFGETNFEGRVNRMIPITAMIGDSHAALFGEGCFKKGATKMTLGTGCSILSNIGLSAKKSKNRMLTTIAYSTQKETVYAWEGAIVSCGSMVEWLKDTLGIIKTADQTEPMAFEAQECALYLIPAFSGLGAPFWQMNRKASLVGMNLGTTKNQIVRATLESICFQIVAVIDAMKKDLGEEDALAMNGGLSKNKYVRHGLKELLNTSIEIQENQDISGFGAALLSGLQQGNFQSLEEIKTFIQKEKMVSNTTDPHLKDRYKKWKEIIDRNAF